MNATKKFAAAIILLIAASAFTIPGLLKEKTAATEISSQKDVLVLYYGITCPHCKIVEEYILQNGLEEKLGVAQKEVYQNQNNNNELVERAKTCGIDLDRLGVPLLWDGNDSKCYEGDQAIIVYLKQKAQLP